MFDLKRPQREGQPAGGGVRLDPREPQPHGASGGGAPALPSQMTLDHTLPTLHWARTAGRKPDGPLRGPPRSSLGPSPKPRPLIPSETQRVAPRWQSRDSISLAERSAQPLTSPSGASAFAAL